MLFELFPLCSCSVTLNPLYLSLACRTLLSILLFLCCTCSVSVQSDRDRSVDPWFLVGKKLTDGAFSAMVAVKLVTNTANSLMSSELDSLLLHLSAGRCVRLLSYGSVCAYFWCQSQSLSTTTAQTGLKPWCEKCKTQGINTNDPSCCNWKHTCASECCSAWAWSLMSLCYELYCMKWALCFVCLFLQALKMWRDKEAFTDLCNEINSVEQEMH